MSKHKNIQNAPQNHPATSQNHIEKTGPKEWLWFVGLWALGVLILTIIGSIIKLIMSAL